MVSKYVDNMPVPFWIKLAASELLRYKLVSRARLHQHYLIVRYKSGLTDKYYFKGAPLNTWPLSFRVREPDLKIGPEIPIQKAYELDPLNPAEQAGCAHHFYLDKKALLAGSFIDRRLAIHRFVAKLARAHLTLDQYPDRKVREWVADLREFNYSTMITSDAFNFYRQLSVRVPWRQVLWQFFPPVLDHRPVRMATVLAQGLERPAQPLDTATVIRGLLRWTGGRILNPLAHCAVLDRLGTPEAVIDLHPEKGYKAIACGLLGIHYIYRPCDAMDLALDRGITEVLGLSCEPLADQRADLLLSDGNFERFDIGGTTPYLDRVNTMVAYVPRADRLRLMAKHEPTRVVKVLCRYVQGRRFKQRAEDPDFMFIW